MTQFRRLFAMFALCASVTGLAVTPARAVGVEGNAGYTVSLSGVNVATVKVRFTENDGRYVLDLDADVTGLGQLVARGSANVDSSGRSTGAALAARQFSMSTRANDETFSVSTAFSGGKVTAFQVTPPLANHAGRVPVERRQLSGVGDALASFILKGQSLSPSLCKQRLRIFTGVERFDIAMSFGASQTATSRRTGYQGPVVLCKMRYVPISGHFTSSEITRYLAGSDRILIWYAPLDDSGYFVPYRVLMGTSVGDLSMVLTSLN